MTHTPLGSSKLNEASQVSAAPLHFKPAVHVHQLADIRTDPDHSITRAVMAIRNSTC